MCTRTEAGRALIQLVGLMLPSLLYVQVAWMGSLSNMNSCQQGLRSRLMKNKGWFDCNASIF
ncbi:hypothetical protein M422DRAFT_36744 [Sphaerobolus stellatus SS14]|uniref:Uncharacterized protein n=1 Tax=Sphaerobolus stellatus (strain SS14) TaxID=990650 RepID=A0A0C9TJW6_SPHS4|nr:hypothetical protein M422DRAFT_36744 [Sphaerobolus stellatus SS14]